MKYFYEYSHDTGISEPVDFIISTATGPFDPPLTHPSDPRINYEQLIVDLGYSLSMPQVGYVGRKFIYADVYANTNDVDHHYVAVYKRRINDEVKILMVVVCKEIIDLTRSAEYFKAAFDFNRK